MLGIVLVGEDGDSTRCFDVILVGNMGSGAEWCVAWACGMIPSIPACDDLSSMR